MVNNHFCYFSSTTTVMLKSIVALCKILTVLRAWKCKNQFFSLAFQSLTAFCYNMIRILGLMLANESMQIFTYLANKIKYDKNIKNNVQPINSANYSVQTAYFSFIYINKSMYLFYHINVCKRKF